MKSQVTKTEIKVTNQHYLKSYHRLKMSGSLLEETFQKMYDNGYEYVCAQGEYLVFKRVTLYGVINES